MLDASACPEPMLSAGETSAGFTVRRVVPLPEIRITAYELEHGATGAQVLHLHCTDRENLFAVAFRTPPHDSTGLPHILEHSVLAGSERYPVKDAFNELLRGSLQTFINAFTYPDKTIYPVASQVKADFYNLARVYADLVFRPRLLPETFRQEGHHLEWTATPAGGRELDISGIVYNEMKGAYSSPDNLMYKALQENLFPDTVYRFDSGGNPRDIPNLTHDDFRAFHEGRHVLSRRALDDQLDFLVDPVAYITLAVDVPEDEIVLAPGNRLADYLIEVFVVDAFCIDFHFPLQIC